jgi:predicted SAM-dependent methyltransferase
MIYMSHVLEHIGRRDVDGALKELFRMLKCDGVLRLSVPDFDRIAHIYAESGGEIAAIDGPLMGGQDYPGNFHFSVFNERFLRSKLLTAGFFEVRSWDPLNCECHDFDDWASRSLEWNGRSFPISLNIEAVKSR